MRPHHYCWVFELCGSGAAVLGIHPKTVDVELCGSGAAGLCIHPKTVDVETDIFFIF